jgi:hypothetical protein
MDSSRPPTRHADSRLKVHLRLVPVGGQIYRVVTLRPGTPLAFSTNFFHQTWHIVTSQPGARLLARLLWGLSFQRHANTVVLVHGGQLLPTPFEGERSDPFLLAVAGLTRLDADALRRLKGRMSNLGPPDRTIRWQTFGLDAALRADAGGQEESDPVADEVRRLRWKEQRRLWSQERMGRLGGLICYAAPPPVLRLQAMRVHGLHVRQGDPTAEMDYHYLAESSVAGSWGADGEVQVFADYVDRVAAATQARRELLADAGPSFTSEPDQEAVSRRRDQIKARRVTKRRRQAARG